MEKKEKQKFAQLNQWLDFIKAAEHGQCETIKQILDSDVALINERDYGTWALRVACFNGRIEVVRLLLNAGLQLNDDDKQHICYQLCHPWCVHDDDSFYKKDRYSARVTCHYAAILQLLYKRGVITVSSDKRFETDLLCQLLWRNYDFCPKIAEYLFELGADETLKSTLGNTSGQTALDIACSAEDSMQALAAHRRPPISTRPCSLKDLIQRMRSRRVLPARSSKDTARAVIASACSRRTHKK